MTDEVMAAWAKAFVAAQSEMPEITKDKSATIPTNKGGSFTYSYADLPTIIEKVRPILTKHELAFAQSVETTETKDLAITTRIYHSAGGVQSFGPLLMPGGGDARSAGSAITYGRRYALCAALGIAADEDDDAEAAAAPKRPQASKSSGEGGATGNGAHQESVSRTDAAPGTSPSPEESHPCPHCGHPAHPTNSSNDKAPKWRCSNANCDGHFNKSKNVNEPWVSWSVDPWKTEATEKPVEGGGNRAATAEAETSGTAPSDRQEPSPGSEPSTPDGSHSLRQLEDAFDAGIVSLGQAIKACMGPCAEANIMPPASKRAFTELPESVLADIVGDLKLEQRLPV